MKQTKIVMSDSYITEQDMKKLMNSCSTPMHRAYISMMYETGGRIREMTNLKIKDVNLTSKKPNIRVENCMGVRIIPLSDKSPYLIEWLDKHPDKNNPDADLWVFVDRLNHKRFVTLNHMIRMLRYTFKKAGLKKRVSFHVFRDTKALNLAKKNSSKKVCKVMGWSF